MSDRPSLMVHGDHSKASGIYDPINNIISYSKTTVAHLMSDDLTVEKVEAISTLLHEAAHRLDLSAHIGDEAMPVSQFNDALGEDAPCELRLRRSMRTRCSVSSSATRWITTTKARPWLLSCSHRLTPFIMLSVTP